MAMGKHYGAFAKGFSDSLLAIMKMQIMQMHYNAMERHWERMEELDRQRGQGKGGFPTDVFNRGRGDPGVQGGDGGGGAYQGGAAAEAHGQEMSQYLQKNYGLSPAGAGAVVGNAWQESKFSSNFKPGGDSGTAAGMFQWRGDRQTDARNWMAQNNKDPSDWKSHLDYAMHETQRDYPGLYKSLQTGTDPAGLTNAFFSTFERGDPHRANMANRTGMATIAANTAAPKTEVAKAVPTKGTKVSEADKPSKAATAEEATTAAPGGGFRIPGDQAAQPFKPYQVAGPWEPPPSDDAAAQQALSPAPPPGSAVDNRIPPAPPPDLAGTNSGPFLGRPDAPGVGTRGLPPRPTIDQATADAGRAALAAPTPVVQPARPTSTGLMPAPAEPAAMPRPMGPDMPPPGQGGGAWSNMPAPSGGGGYYPTGRAPAPPVRAADRPAPAAQPVSSPAAPAAPVTPRVSQDPRFVQVDRPNADPTGRGGGAPQMTALNLGSLWGANPPTPKQAPTPMGQGGGDTPYGVARQSAMPAPMRPQDQDFAVGTPDMSNVSFSARGGPIQKFARGGIPTRPTMRYATAGPVDPTYPTYTPAAPAAANTNPSTGYLGGNTLAADQFMTGLPGMQSVNLSAYPAWLYGGNTIPAQQLGSDWSAMNPVQQQQYSQMLAGTWTPPAATPAATPAPAAPSPTIINPPSVQNITNYPASTTVTDPTSTTVTGAVNLPNSITAASYNPNVDATTGAAFTNTTGSGGTNYNVGTDDTLQPTSTNTISGTTAQDQAASTQILSRKGGPIQRFARGGIPSRPMMKFQAGGASGYQATMAPGYSGPTLTGGWTGSTPYSALAPNQQAWANTTQGLLGQIYAGGQQDAAFESATGKQGPVDTSQYMNQITAMPSAIWPTAPTAPTSIAEPPPSVSNITAPQVNTTTIDPTSTTTTGAPGLPNMITANSYNPNVDATTGAGFANTSSTGGTNYSVGSDDTLQQTSPGTISGQNNTTILSRKGGPITRSNVTPRVRYDDGGGVSPSVAGMPPGLSGGAGQAPAIPPIYFNPATYSAAGAPVGKGVSATSAPVYNAGAVPALPMQRGGVVGYDDGGGVGDLPDTSYEDMQMNNEMEAQARSGASAQPMDTSGSNVNAGYGGLNLDESVYSDPSGRSIRVGDPQPPANPNDQSYPPNGIDYNSKPPGTPEWMPQGRDNAGNPSKGVISAISDGMHWLGGQLGLGGGQQGAIAGNPGTQTARHNFTQGNMPDGTPSWTAQDAQKLGMTLDPKKSLTEGMRNLMGLEAVHNFYLTRGDTAGAAKAAAAMMQYSVHLSSAYGAEAYKRYGQGDLNGVADMMTKAKDSIADGTLAQAKVNPDGQSIDVAGTNLAGEKLWETTLGPQQILHAVVGMANGSMAWHAYEMQAGKYDPGYAQKIKDRAAGREADAETEYWKTQNQPTTEAPPTAPTAPPPALPGPGAAPGTTLTAANAPPAKPYDSSGPPTFRILPDEAHSPQQISGPLVSGAGGAPAGDTRGTSQAATPPPMADNRMAALGPTGHGAGPAIPPGPTGTTQADVPSAVAQPVDFEKMEDNARAQAISDIQARYADAAKSLPPEPPRPDQNPNFVNLNANGKANAWKDYGAQLNARRAQVHDLNARMNTDIATANKDISDRIAVRRQTQANADIQTRQETQATRTHGWELEKEGRERGYKTSDEATAQANKLAVLDYADQIKRAEPRNPNEAREELGAADPRVALAQSFLPDVAKLDPASVTGDQAGTALVAAGFDPGAQQVLSQALHAGFMNSPLTTKEEVARGVMLFASGNPGAGVLDPRTGVRHVAVSDDKGYASTFSVPESVYQNLKILNAKGRYAADTKAAIANAPPPEARPSTVPASTAPMGRQGDVSGPGWYAQHRPAIAPAPQ